MIQCGAKRDESRVSPGIDIRVSLFKMAQADKRFKFWLG